MSDSVKHKIASFVLFNVLWLSAVAGREQYIWLTLALVVAQVGYSLWVANIKLRLILQLLAVYYWKPSQPVLAPSTLLAACSRCGWRCYGSALPQ